MILHREAERIFAQANLLDDAIMHRPSLHVQIVPEPINRLMMGAVNFWKAVRSVTCAAQCLNVAMLLLREIVALDVQL